MPNTDKLQINVPLVRKLIAKQFPQWKHLPIKPVAVGGWDNRTFHLGEQMLVRMPSDEEYAPKVEKEQKWLPRLAPLLPLEIPKPLAMGDPDNGYPWQWSVYNWIEGDTASASSVTNLNDFAICLAQFLNVLQHIDSTGGPAPYDSESFAHIGALAYYDKETRESIAILKNKIDTQTAARVWESALETTWQAAPVWVHGDISPGNLLVKEGRLTAVIDFGGLAVGDPACDLRIAWTFLDEKSREVFRSALPLDAGTWARGQGWALWKALIIAAGLYESNPVEIAQTWRTLEEVIKDYHQIKILKVQK